MPYTSNSELPKGVRHVLPYHGQEIYREAFNHAFEFYKSKEKRREGTREETAHRVAWSAVEKKYHKMPNGEWVENK